MHVNYTLIQDCTFTMYIDVISSLNYVCQNMMLLRKSCNNKIHANTSTLKLSLVKIFVTV
jgi:hypothetical protein